MALGLGLPLGLVFNKLLLRSFGGLGSGLEPGKGINYTPFSYSLSRPSHPFFPFPFPALSSSSFPFLLSCPLSVPFLLSLVPIPLYFWLVIPQYVFVSLFLFFYLSSGRPLALLAPRSVPRAFLLLPGSLFASFFLAFPGGHGRGRAEEPGLLLRPSPRFSGAAGVRSAPNNLSERERTGVLGTRSGALAACPSVSLQ